MNTETKEKILSIVKRMLKYTDPKLPTPATRLNNSIIKQIDVIPLGCEFTVPDKIESQNRFIKRQIKDLISDELIKFVKIKKEVVHGKLRITGLLEVLK